MGWTHTTAVSTGMGKYCWPESGHKKPGNFMGFSDSSLKHNLPVFIGPLGSGPFPAFMKWDYFDS